MDAVVEGQLDALLAVQPFQPGQPTLLGLQPIACLDLGQMPGRAPEASRVGIDGQQVEMRCPIQCAWPQREAVQLSHMAAVAYVGVDHQCVVAPFTDEVIGAPGIRDEEAPAIPREAVR